MRPPKTLSRVTLVVMLPQLTGCAFVRPYQGDPPSSPESADTDQQLRVTTTGGETIVLQKVRVEDGQIHGHAVTRTAVEIAKVMEAWGSLDVLILVSEVERIESQGGHEGTSLGLFVGSVAAIFLVIGGMVAPEAGLIGTWSSGLALLPFGVATELEPRRRPWALCPCHRYRHCRRNRVCAR